MTAAIDVDVPSGERFSPEVEIRGPACGIGAAEFVHEFLQPDGIRSGQRIGVNPGISRDRRRVPVPVGHDQPARQLDQQEQAQANARHDDHVAQQAFTFVPRIVIQGCLGHWWKQTYKCLYRSSSILYVCTKSPAVIR